MNLYIFNVIRSLLCSHQTPLVLKPFYKGLCFSGKTTNYTYSNMREDIDNSNDFSSL